jgi:hypothetical protein
MGFYQEIISMFILYWVPLLYILGLPWATLGFFGLPWAILGVLGLPWAILGVLGLP